VSDGRPPVAPDAPQPPGAGTAPNLLLVMTDQQRFDSLRAYGFEAGHTPHLDGLAADGATFERCYATNPICSPSRASLLTGHHLPDHGVYRLYDVLPDDEVLFPERLRVLGYQTALVGKLHVSSMHAEAEARHPHDGFDVYEWCNEGCVRMDSPFHAYARWLDEVDPAFRRRLETEGRAVLHHPAHLHLSHWAAERTIAFLRERDPDRPFFCLMSLFDPHNPYRDYPPHAADGVDADAIPAPVDDDLARRPEALRREQADGYFGDARELSPEELRTMRRDYHANVAFADEEIGRVLAALDDLGLRERTLVVFCSDHGDMIGDHGLLVKGAFFFDPCVRVPLLMRWPGVIEPGTRVGGLAQLHDLAATFLAAAGAAPADLRAWMPDARDLLPAATEGTSVREAAVCAYRDSGISTRGAWDPPLHGTMWREGGHKLNVFHLPDGRVEGELYDMATDPDELHDLWDDPAHATTKAHLLGRLLDWTFRAELGRGSRGGERRPAPRQVLDNAYRGPAQ
jgi:arylsulfatase